MATSSIFSSIQIKDMRSAERLVDAMVAAEEARDEIRLEPVKIKELKGEDLRAFLKRGKP